MAEKSRILVFTTAFRPMIGGSELALEEIIRRLPDIFFDIVTPKYKAGFDPFEVGSNFNVHRVGVGAGVLDKIIFPVLGFFKALMLMRNNSYDAMHAYQASHGGGTAWLVKLFYSHLLFVLTMQEGKKLDEQSALLNWFRGLIIKRADIVTVISSYLEDYVNKISKNKKIFLIPNGVDIDKFKIDPPAGGEKLKINGKTIITVSRLVKKNGVGDLIEAFRLLVTSYQLPVTSYQLIIIGDGPLREDLELRITNYELRGCIKIIGKVLPDEIPKYLARADVFVRPSLSEGLGTAFLEAMAAGLPVIGTPVGGILDFLRDPSTHSFDATQDKSGQATGLFCKVGDPEDIAKKINIVLSDGNLRSRLITNGRKLVEEKYNWDKIAEEFRNLYESI